MKLTALLTIKNEEYYLKYCIENLIKQGFEIYLIDNGSIDNSLEIARKYLHKGIVKIDYIDTGGVFKLEEILKFEENIANSYDSDWFMHCDADEIRLPHRPFKTIKDALIKVESLGYNAVNFHLFNFMPEDGKSYIGKNYEDEMKYYYFHSSEPFSQIKLWKKTENLISFGTSGGHRVFFENMKIYPNPFILKHYIFLSKQHAIDKYTKKSEYSQKEVQEYGWHGFRANFDEKRFHLPRKSQLKKLTNNIFDISDPTPEHLFYEWGNNQDYKQVGKTFLKLESGSLDSSKNKNLYKANSYLYRILRTPIKNIKKRGRLM